MKEKFLFLYATLTAPKLSVSTIARILAPQRGTVVFQHACKMGLEGMVSKRLGSRYGWGRSPDWLKFTNPEALR